MQQKIGFDWQPVLSGACGKYSLGHALLLVGIPLTKKEANKATGVPTFVTIAFGTNEKQLKKGIKYYDCHPIEYSTTRKNNFRQKLDGLLKKGIPSIVSLQGDDHWAVICGKRNKDEYYYIDSADSELISYYHWDELVADIDNDTYYLIGVKPNNANYLKHSLVHNFSEVEKVLNRGDELYEWWGYYLEDLNEVFDCPDSTKNVITASEFFDTWGRKIFNTAKYFYQYFDEEQMKWELNNYRKVAELHNLTLSKDKLNEALISFSAALTYLSIDE